MQINIPFLKSSFIYAENGFFSVRIVNLFFKIKNVKKHSLIFSERYGYDTGAKIGRYYFSFRKLLTLTKER